MHTLMYTLMLLLATGYDILSQISTPLTERKMIILKLLIYIAALSFIFVEISPEY